MGVLRAAAEGGGGVKDEDEPKITIVGALVERHGKYLMVERLKRYIKSAKHTKGFCIHPKQPNIH